VSVVESEDRWNLSHLYPDDVSWQAAAVEATTRLGDLERLPGTLAGGAGHLLAALELIWDLERAVARIGAYASQRSDDDTRDPQTLEMRQRAAVLATDLHRRTSFLEPEILALGSDTVGAFLAAEPGLAPYSFPLHEILRRAPHTLGTEAEGILADAGLLADTAYDVYSILTEAEIPWPRVVFSDGTDAVLDQAGYARHRARPDREQRQQVFEAFWTTWTSYERTCGVALYSHLKRDLFFARARRHPDCLGAALDGNAIPAAVYHTLVAAANRHLGLLHRALRLQGRMIGVSDLRPWDLYRPAVTSPHPWSAAEGREVVLESLRHLGSDYVTAVRRGFREGWMDTFPRPGKRSGAYASGAAYDVHPYVLMNWTDDWDSVSTLAHEWGHAMHSLLANGAQAYPTAEYPIFLAEVASTFNEALLLDHALDRCTGDDERLFLLGSALEGLRGTFFRQAMFAEFELEAHRLVEAGEAPSGSRFSEVYGVLLRRYLGHHEGVVTVDDRFFVEWSYVPHFYFGFYVYQYATSMAAAALLSREVLDGVAGARDRYLGLLRAGGSSSPYPLLCRAGVDLASAGPYDALAADMERIMDEIDSILDRRMVADEVP
jgi:oligoendopeptidase F